jgi:signal transduction histidine kinase
MRDDVLGIVAHDLRNPLSAILMQTSVLRLRGAEGDPRLRKPVEAVERAARRMSDLIQDLLDVTSMEAGRLSVEKVRSPAGELVTDCVETQVALATSASLVLHTEVPPGLPEVCADRGRIQQVFENLIGNAVKFTAPGGRVTVGAALRSREVLFWVADTGPGIPPQDLPHVFDRFWQAQKGGRQGAGLGLPIVKGLVELHGGRIWVESTLGQGTTFFFAIPAASTLEAQVMPARRFPRTFEGPSDRRTRSQG